MRSAGTWLLLFACVFAAACGAYEGYEKANRDFNYRKNIATVLLEW